jgi:outer membrane biogenesis lipoprotein LolB
MRSSPITSLYHWLGIDAEPEPWAHIKLPDNAEFHHLGAEVEDDGWITIYPKLKRPKQPTA